MAQSQEWKLRTSESTSNTTVGSYVQSKNSDQKGSSKATWKIVQIADKMVHLKNTSDAKGVKKTLKMSLDSFDRNWVVTEVNDSPESEIKKTSEVGIVDRTMNFSDVEIDGTKGTLNTTKFMNYSVKIANDGEHVIVSGLSRLSNNTVKTRKIKKDSQGNEFFTMKGEKFPLTDRITASYSKTYNLGFRDNKVTLSINGKEIKSEQRTLKGTSFGFRGQFFDLYELIENIEDESKLEVNFQVKEFKDASDETLNSPTEMVG